MSVPSTHMLAGAEVHVGPGVGKREGVDQFPLSPDEALREAEWLIRYAADSPDGKPLHRAVRCHSVAASSQITAMRNALKLDPQ